MKKALITTVWSFVILALTICGVFAEDNSEVLEIDVSSLTDEPTFIDWIQGNTHLQLIALKDPDGSIRLAFNTCQACKGSPWAWFEYQGNGVLQCQNCMQRLSIESVGTEKAPGCSPISILDFSEIDGTISISEDILMEAEPWFKNWKRTGE